MASRPLKMRQGVYWPGWLPPVLPLLLRIASNVYPMMPPPLPIIPPPVAGARSSWRHFPRVTSSPGNKTFPRSWTNQLPVRQRRVGDEAACPGRGEGGRRGSPPSYLPTSRETQTMVVFLESHAGRLPMSPFLPPLPHAMPSRPLHTGDTCIFALSIVTSQ